MGNTWNSRKNLKILSSYTENNLEHQALAVVERS